MITGEQIRAARKRAGLSQGRLAELVGVSMRTVGNWERGESSPGIAEPRLQDVLADHLQASGDAPRRSRFESVTDAELLAEIAARFARTAASREEGAEDVERPATTKMPGVAVIGAGGVGRSDLDDEAARDVGRPGTVRRIRDKQDQAGEPLADDPDDMEPR